MRQVKEDGKRYTRMGFSKEIQKARKRKTKLEFAGKTCTKEQVCDILESRDFSPELFASYYEIIPSKAFIEGKDLEREMTLTHRHPIAPDMIFIPIKQMNHQHLLIVNFNGKALMLYNHCKTAKRHQIKVNRVIGWMYAYLSFCFEDFDRQSWSRFPKSWLSNKREAKDHCSLQTLLAIEFLCMGMVSAWTDDDMQSAQWCLDGIRRCAKFVK